ncbi:MAG: hypothetical protein V3V32_04515 [Dehalococcoidia bacterium]
MGFPYFFPFLFGVEHFPYTFPFLFDVEDFKIPAQREIYKNPYKTAGLVRVRIRLDKPVAGIDFVDEFAGGALDPDKWSSWQPPNTSITVAGGRVTLQSTAETNGFPVIQSVPGKTFPLDRSIGWTMEFTIDFPTITGFGVQFRVCDLQQPTSIIEIECNEDAGYTVEMPAGNVVESLGLDTSEYNFTLQYIPPTNIANASYELRRGGVLKGTLDATDRQAWYIFAGNGSVQTNLGNWTTLRVNRVDVNLVSAESQDYPIWTDKETLGDGSVWGRLPWVNRVSTGGHKRNAVDQAVITLSQSGFVTGIPGDINGLGYRADMFAGFDWLNREVRIEMQQSNGRNSTSWKERFRGLCDEPQLGIQDGRAMLRIVVREATRRRLQMTHTVRGYSDAAGAIDGVIMNRTWTQMIEDMCQVCGLDAGDYLVLYSSLKPRSWQVLGTSLLDEILELADQGVAAVYRCADQVDPGQLRVQEWSWGNKTPDFYLHVDHDIISIDWAESYLGATAQVVETIQHSDFGEFSDIYPHAPVPPFGAVIRHNASIAQLHADINQTRILPYLRWKVANREIRSIAVRVVGQDWLEHDLQCRVIDPRILGLGPDEYWAVDGWNEEWDATQGLRTTIHLVNQDFQQTIMKARLDRTVQVVY